MPKTAWFSALTIALLAPITASAQGTTSDSAASARATVFIEQLIDSMPAMLELLPPSLRSSAIPATLERFDTLYPGMPPDTTKPFRDLSDLATTGLGISWGSPADPKLDPAIALDSLRALWPRLKPTIASYWLLARGGATAVGNTIVRFAGADPTRLGLAQRFANGLEKIAATFREGSEPAVSNPKTTTMAIFIAVTRRSRSDELAAAAATIKGAVLLARGDTVAAVKAMLPAIGGEYSPWTGVWAATIGRLSEHRSDLADAYLIATAVEYLRSTWNVAVKDSLYSRVLDAFLRYTASNDTPPDIARPEEFALARPAGIDLDGYLDRQFWIFYDYEFTVGRASAALRSKGRQRLVVGEFLTGIG